MLYAEFSAKVQDYYQRCEAVVFIGATFGFEVPRDKAQMDCKTRPIEKKNIVARAYRI